MKLGRWNWLISLSVYDIREEGRGTGQWPPR